MPQRTCRGFLCIGKVNLLEDRLVDLLNRLAEAQGAVEPARQLAGSTPRQGDMFLLVPLTYGRTNIQLASAQSRREKSTALGAPLASARAAPVAPRNGAPPR